MSNNQKNIDDKLTKIRHSLSHILAMAVLEKFPKAKLGIGPTIEGGFYYDFELPDALGPDDLPQLENKMKEIIKNNIVFKKEMLSTKDARIIFKNQLYKLELIEELAKKHKPISIYYSGKFTQSDKTSLAGFTDLCAGPHINSTKEINPNAFKLTKVSGAYWRGDEKQPMLTRIYGIAFLDKKNIAKYNEEMEKAEKNDHRKLNKTLEFFHVSDIVGKGLPLWLPNGATVRRILERFIVDEELRRGYLHVYTPVIGRTELYKISGHLDYYRDTMYPAFKVDKEEYILRPMTCPHHFMIYKAKPKSYRELPMRIAEISPMYRKEKSGELSGLIRVMGFTLSDAHIMVRPDQLEKEFANTLDLIYFVLKALGIKDKVWPRASLRDKEKSKYLENEDLWESAEEKLLSILKKMKLKYATAEGEATFYGPKVDFQIKNIWGKEETLITSQIDFLSAERFEMEYTDEKGKPQRPIVIHRSSIGALERTIAFLMEQHAGNLPIWLSPIQASIIPISDKHSKYADKIAEELRKNNIRVEVSNQSETVSYKIRGAELRKIPYIIVVGDKEQKNKTISVRQRQKGNVGAVKIQNFVKNILKEIKDFK